MILTQRIMASSAMSSDRSADEQKPVKSSREFERSGAGAARFLPDLILRSGAGAD